MSDHDENDQDPKLNLENASIETVIASQGHDIGTRILQKNESIPSIFESATVIRPSILPSETPSRLSDSPVEGKSQTVVTQIHPTKIVKRRKPRDWRSLYAKLNDLTSLSHWTGRTVWVTAISALAFMIFLNTTPPVDTQTSRPAPATPPKAPTPITQPKVSLAVNQIPVSVPPPLATSREVAAKPRMKVEFMVHLHELIDKSRRFAPDYTP